MKTLQKKETYKGYEIHTTANGNHFTSLIIKYGNTVGGTFSDTGKNNSVEKAKSKIDKYHQK